MAERWIWSRPRDEIPRNLDQLKEKIQQFSDLCCQSGSTQQTQIYNTFYGSFDTHYNERRGGLIGRFFLGAQNGGEALDGVNLRKERHEATLPDDWQKYEGSI